MIHMYAMIILFLRLARGHHCDTVPQISNVTPMYAMITLFLRLARGHHCDTVPQISNVTPMYAMITLFLRLARGHHCDTVPRISNVTHMYAMITPFPQISVMRGVASTDKGDKCNQNHSACTYTRFLYKECRTLRKRSNTVHYISKRAPL